MNNHVTAAPHISFLAIASLAVLTLFITACSSSSDSSTPTYTVGGSVTGTSGTGLVLQLNAANNLTIAADGIYTFTPALTSGTSYAVTVLSAPSGQTCRVTNGSGNLTANVSNVGVECRTNDDPNGYYTNTGNASVGDGVSGTLNITDFQAIVQDDRFMVMSVAEGLVYDGPLEMFGSEFTATVSVYRDGVMIYSNVSVSGSLIEGASISGTLAGTEEGAGSFGLVFALTNSSVASIPRIQAEFGMTNPDWQSIIGGTTSNMVFEIYSSGSVYGTDSPTDGIMNGCAFRTVSGGTPVAIIPIIGTSLYRVTVQLIFCSNNALNTIAGSAGYYTGFATSRTDSATPDDTLVFMVTSANGQYTASGDFK